MNLSVLLGFAAFAFGLVFGSFGNVVIWRLPRGESLSTPGSHCPKCDAPITWRDNIPVLSWVLLRARCRSCGQPISMRYPAVELLSALLWLAAYLAFGPSVRCAFAILFFYVLMLLSVIDIDTMRLPNDLVMLLFVAGIAGLILALIGGMTTIPLLSPSGGILPLIGAVLGVAFAVGFAAIVAVAYRLLRKTQGFGMGDIKLLAVIGLYVGPSALLVLFIASAMGAVVGIASALRSGQSMTAKVPFGPYLAGAAVIVTLWGPNIWSWYLGVSGR